MMVKTKNPLFFLVLLVFVMFAFLFCFSGQALAAQKITLIIDGEEIVPDVAPYIDVKTGRAMVPIRYATEPMGAILSWQGGSNATAYIYKDNITVTLPIGKKEASINGISCTLDSPAVIKNGRTMVPIRFLAEGMGASVAWEGTTKTITISWPDSLQVPPSTSKVIGYYYDSASLDALSANADTLTGVIHFSYQMDASGNISQTRGFASDLFYAENGGLAVAQANNIPAQLLVTDSFVSSVPSNVLPSATLRAQAISQIVTLVKQNGLIGVNLDFEAVPVSCRDSFVLFVKELKEALGKNYTVSLSLRPRSDSSQTWMEGYDYEALSRYADLMIVMCYNQHYSTSEPGPVAGLSWTESVIQYILDTGVDNSKLILGLGCYGYSWPQAGSGSSVRLTRVTELIEKYNVTVQWSQENQVPWFTYTDDTGMARELWFEDVTSMGLKAALVPKYQLGGVALWRLGFPSQEMYDAIVTNSSYIK